MDRTENPIRTRERRIQPRALLVALTAGLAACATPEKTSIVQEEKESDWVVGLRELREQTLFSSVEEARGFVIVGDSVQEVGRDSGNATGILSSTSRMREAEAVRRVLENSGGVPRVCHLHTHLVSSAEEVGFLEVGDANRVRSEGERATFSIPPSEPDVSFALENKVRAAFSGVDFDYRVGYIHGVVTPGGVWYFRPLTEEELSELPQSIRRTLEKRRAAQEEWAQFAEERIARLDDMTIRSLFTLVFNNNQPTLSPVMYETSSGTKERAELRDALVRRNQTLLNYLVSSPQEKELYARYAKVDDPYGRELDKIRRSQVAFMRASYTRPITETDYESIADQYARYAGVKLRFVPFEEALEELPCEVEAPAK